MVIRHVCQNHKQAGCAVARRYRTGRSRINKRVTLLLNLFNHHILPGEEWHDSSKTVALNMIATDYKPLSAANSIPRAFKAAERQWWSLLRAASTPLSLSAFVQNRERVPGAMLYSRSVNQHGHEPTIGVGLTPNT